MSDTTTTTVVDNVAAVDKVEAQVADTDNSPQHRLRRDWFVIATVAAALLGTIGLAKFATDSESVHRAIDGLTSFAADVSMLFVGANVLDHTGLLTAVGNRFGRK